MSKLLRIELGEMRHNLRNFDRRANEAISRVFVFQEARSESYMKTNARWTDQTTNARNGLFAKAFSEGDEHLLLLSHSVSYGIYLETVSAGKYGIIVDSWARASDEIWTTLRKLFALMEGG
jgi:hypothetical protein